MWDVAFLPRGNLGYATMADSGDIFVFDVVTRTAFGAPIPTFNNAYGGSLVITSFPY